MKKRIVISREETISYENDYVVEFPDEWDSEDAGSTLLAIVLDDGLSFDESIYDVEADGWGYEVLDDDCKDKEPELTLVSRQVCKKGDDK